MDAMAATAGCCEGSKSVGQIQFDQWRARIGVGAYAGARTCRMRLCLAADAWNIEAANRVLTLKVHDSGQFGWASRQGVVAE